MLLIWAYRVTLGFFGLGYLWDAFVMCCCIERLRTKSEIRIVSRQRSIELAMKVKTTKDAEKYRESIKRELVRLPGYRFADPQLNASFHHIKMNLPLECCAKCEEFTVQDTKIDRVSVAVTETHKTKPQTPRIPVSLCCPVCAAGPCKLICSFLLPKLRATDVHEQDIFHHSGTEMARVYTAPYSDISSLMKIWCVGGLCGAHLFKARRVKRGLFRVFVFVLLVIMILTLLAITIINVQVEPECAKDFYSRAFDGINRDKRVCSRCPSGKTAPAESTSLADCKEESNSEASGSIEPSSSTSRSQLATMCAQCDFAVGKAFCPAIMGEPTCHWNTRSFNCDKVDTKITNQDDCSSIVDCSFDSCPRGSPGYGLTCRVSDCNTDFCAEPRCESHAVLSPSPYSYINYYLSSQYTCGSKTIRTKDECGRAASQINVDMYNQREPDVTYAVIDHPDVFLRI